MFRTYLSLHGEGFDPVRFQSRAGGSVEHRYRMNQGVKEIADTFWKSPERRDLTVHNLDEELRSLLVHLRPMIKAVSPPPSSAWAHVVQEYEYGADISGVYVSHATLTLLAELHVELDIDITQSVR